MEKAHLLDISELTISFTGDYGTHEVADRLSLSVGEGEVVCLVGESGCGKSVTAMSVLGLLGTGGRVTGGSIRFGERELLSLSEKELDTIRGKEISMIFQDPMSSLNPVFTIGYQIRESLLVHTSCTRKEADIRVVELLAQVGLKEPEKLMKKYPHTLSGGMRQRVMIAMALACEPKLLIADEPTTALDVSVQSQILALLKELQRKTHMAMLLITHDMGVVSEMADRVLVMYAGQIVEEATSSELFHHPLHPYTKALLEAIPTTHDGKDRKLLSIPGMVPENYDTIKGCRFAERCPYAENACEAPIALKEAVNGHPVRCIAVRRYADS